MYTCTWIIILYLNFTTKSYNTCQLRHMCKCQVSQGPLYRSLGHLHMHSISCLFMIMEVNVLYMYVGSTCTCLNVEYACIYTWLIFAYHVWIFSKGDWILMLYFVCFDLFQECIVCSCCCNCYKQGCALPFGPSPNL